MCNNKIMFIKSRRDLLEFLLNNRLVEANKITGKAVIRKYREISDRIFCLDVFRDNCYEKYWLTGYEVGYKQGADEEAPETSAPANALSRMCGEIATLYQEGYFKKLDRGLYSVDAIPVYFGPRVARTDEASEFVEDVLRGAHQFAGEAKKAAHEVKKAVNTTIDIMKVATEAATKAVQEHLKKTAV